jgi:hypothetical protein
MIGIPNAPDSGSDLDTRLNSTIELKKKKEKTSCVDY